MPTVRIHGTNNGFPATSQLHMQTAVLCQASVVFLTAHWLSALLPTVKSQVKHLRNFLILIYAIWLHSMSYPTRSVSVGRRGDKRQLTFEGVNILSPSDELRVLLRLNLSLLFRLL